MTWTRVVVVVVLAQVSVLVAALDKQIKLEDIERDNLQTELLKQQRGHAYQQQQQQQQQQQAEPIDQGFTYQTHHPRTQHQPHQHQQAQHQQPQHHYRFEQQLQVQPERPQLSPHHQHHQQLLYQAVPQAVMPTHIMYLIMPNGNVAAFQLAPHPNHIQAYYSPGKQQFGTLFHQQQQALHQAMQQAAVPMLQYYQPQAPQSHVPQVPQFVQRFQQPSVHHQPSLSFNSPQAHQLHAQHFRELSAEAPAAPEAPVINPDISSYSAHPAQPSVQQSPKSLFGTGVKVTASPQLKGSFSTQTGQSYTNFRQYG